MQVLPTLLCALLMLLTRLLNACHHFPGFVYEGARLDEAAKTIEIDVRPRRKFDSGRQTHARAALEMLRNHTGLSRDVFEIVERSLG